MVCLADVAPAGRVVTAKVPTTPADQSEGVMAAVSLALERARLTPRDIGAFAHGMTVATNALLEERGARVRRNHRSRAMPSRAHGAWRGL